MPPSLHYPTPRSSPQLTNESRLQRGSYSLVTAGDLGRLDGRGPLLRTARGYHDAENQEDAETRVGPPSCAGHPQFDLYSFSVLYISTGYLS